MMSKKRAQRIHAKRRCRERYGISLGRKKYYEIIRMIRSGNSQVVKRKSNRTTIHNIKYKGLDMTVVYDKKRGQIATFLPFREARGGK